MNKGKLVATSEPISALIYAPITHEFSNRMQNSAKFHGFDYHQLVAQLAQYLSYINRAFGLTESISKISKYPKD